MSFSSPQVATLPSAFLREPFNAVSHGLAAFVGLCGLAGLIHQAQGARAIVAASVYGLTLVALFLSSALYHGLRVAPSVTAKLRRCDHAMIFLFIAGSYTPVTLLLMQGAWGWGLFGLVWVVAVAGLIVNAVLPMPPRWLAATLYIGMGWLAVVAIQPLRDVLSPEGFGWLFAGGVVYTAGAIVYAMHWPRLWPGRFGPHELWHVFVMVASAVHYVFILRFTLV